jgi:hypothetical protein
MVEPADSWQPLSLSWQGAVARTAPPLNGWYRPGDGYVLTLAASPPVTPAPDPALPTSG